jgi:hypothetical protein
MEVFIAFSGILCGASKVHRRCSEGGVTDVYVGWLARR